ncbi:hypothetical protein BT93_B0457 [Corymbia citriodora subsp. variegata]|nr:hypothetical protein BT93_B0457 [Corymbia citriodora subsp. variegata]
MENHFSRTRLDFSGLGDKETPWNPYRDFVLSRVRITERSRFL